MRGCGMRVRCRANTESKPVMLLLRCTRSVLAKSVQKPLNRSPSTLQFQFMHLLLLWGRKEKELSKSMGLSSILPIYTNTWLLLDKAQMNINSCQSTRSDCWPSCLSYHSWDLDEQMLELILSIACNLMPRQAFMKYYQHHVSKDFQMYFL